MRVWLVGAAALALGAMAGCSDGGGDDERSFDEALDDAIEDFDEATALAYTPANAPVPGSASYEGSIYFDVAATEAELDGNTDLIGDLDLNVDFDGSSGEFVTGRADNFVAEGSSGEDDVQFDGSLEVGNGQVNLALDPDLFYNFGADLDGTLTGDGESYVIDGGLDGNFTGSNFDYVVGDAEGTICQLNDCAVLDGGFAGERD